MFKQYRRRKFASSISKEDSLKKSVIVVRDTALLQSNTTVIDTAANEEKGSHADEIERENTLLGSQENIIGSTEDTDAAISKALHLIQNYIPPKKPSVFTAVSKRWKNAIELIRSANMQLSPPTVSRTTEEYNWIMKSVNERVMIEIKLEEEENALLVHRRPLFRRLDLDKSVKATPFFSSKAEVKIIDILRSDLNYLANLFSRDPDLAIIEDTECKFNSKFLKRILQPQRQPTHLQTTLNDTSEAVTISEDDILKKGLCVPFKVGIQVERMCKKILSENTTLKSIIKEELVPNQFRYPVLFGQSDIDLVFEADSEQHSDESSSIQMNFDHIVLNSNSYPLERENGEYDYTEFETMLKRKKFIIQSHLGEEEMIQNLQQTFREDPYLTMKRPQLKRHLRIHSCPQKPTNHKHQRFSSNILKDPDGLKNARKYLFPLVFGKSAIDLGKELEKML